MKSSSRADWPVAAALGLAVANLVASIVFVFLASTTAKETLDRTQALAQAQTRVPILLSYTHASLRKDMTRAEDQTTGTFHSDFIKLVNQVIVPVGDQRKISTTATVTGAGVIGTRGSAVEVLVFLTQTTTAPGASPSRITSAVVVTMKHVGTTWKIASLAPQTD